MKDFATDMIEIILGSAEDVFLQIGVFVGAVLLIFGLINYKQKGKPIQRLIDAKRLQPLFGALLGLTPGCGGAIFVMPLYLKGSISFGTVVATLVATMGDSAFVLISTNPIQYVYVSAICFVTAILTGYAVDKLGIDGGLAKTRSARLRKLEISKEQHQLISNNITRHIGHTDGDEVDVLFHHSKTKHQVEAKIIWFTHHIAYKIFWLIAGIGLILGILLLCQVNVNTSLGITNIGAIIGVSGTIICVLYMIITKRLFKNEDHIFEEEKVFSLKETLVHNAEDTAFVTTWCFVAYLIYEFTVYAIGGDDVVKDWLIASGVMTVLIGALVGLIPGCGPQILFVTLYSRGMLPFAALIANAVSQDGDALFPLLAIDRRSALTATLITTIPALIIGLAWFFLFD